MQDKKETALGGQPQTAIMESKDTRNVTTKGIRKGAISYTFPNWINYIGREVQIAKFSDGSLKVFDSDFICLGEATRLQDKEEAAQDGQELITQAREYLNLLIDKKGQTVATIANLTHCSRTSISYFRLGLGFEFMATQIFRLKEIIDAIDQDYLTTL